MNPILILFSFMLASCGNTQHTQSTEKTSPQQVISSELPIPSETINIKDYGAKGLGVASLKEDTIALRKAIAYLNSKGGGRLYVPNPPKFYAFAGDGVFVGDNIEIYGDGKGKSEIRNVDPLSGSFLHGPIFLFSTYGATDKINVFQEGIEQYDISDAKLNDQQVVLKNPANGSKLFKGEIVVLGSGKFNHGTDEGKSRFHYMELNEISAITNGEILFKYPLSVNLVSEDGSLPVIVNINNTPSQNKFLGIKNGTSKNIYLHDMSLTQAQKNEVTNQILSKDEMTNGLSGVWQPGGAFASKFNNLYISCYSGLGGNMFTRCEFSNIDLEAKKKLIDFGYGASNNSVHDINWIYMKSSASDFASSFIIVNDGTHNIDLYNIKASGDWSGENIILLSQAKNINIYDAVFDFPNYSNSSTGVSIGDKDESFSENILLSNIKINISKIGFFITMNGENTINEKDRKLKLSNLTFSGVATGDRNFIESTGGNPKKTQKKSEKVSNNNKIGIGFLARNINGLEIQGLSTSSGDFLFLNCNNTSIQKINAPYSNLITKNSSINTSGNTFRQTMTDVKKIKSGKN